MPCDVAELPGRAGRLTCAASRPFTTERVQHGGPPLDAGRYDGMNFCGGFSERGALSLKFTAEATMPLATGPLWDIKESCLWFEIAYKSGRILCRIDALCFMNSLEAKSLSG